MRWMRRLGIVLTVLVSVLAASAAQADDVLVLKDGRRIEVRRLARRGGQVLFETTRGESFSVPEDQVVSPALDSIPQAGAPAAGTQATEQTLVLTDGRRLQVRRLGRRDGLVLFETTRGEAFSVSEQQVVSPPLDSIPRVGGGVTAAEPTEQTLVLKDGRRLQVLRLARRGGQVLFQTTRGEGFSVPEDQVVSPAVETIPSLDAGAAPPTPPTPEVVPSPEAPAPPTAVPAVPKPPVAEPDYEPVESRWGLGFPEDPRWPQRWRLVDPYNQNILKGDKPIIGNSTFLALTGVFDVPSESRRLPVPGGVSTLDPGTFEFFGRGEQVFTTPRALISAELFKGQTAFRPKTWAVKVTSALNLNYVRLRERNLVNVDVREGESRKRQDFSLEEAFAEVKLADLSHNYDFVSVRAGIQPFVSDFRGLVFSDFNLGGRLFGSLADNRLQYNAAYFDLLEKETNSELNTFEKREQKVFIANAFYQDFLTKGYTISLSYHDSKDEPNIHYDENGFLTRPAPVGRPVSHEVRSRYVGLAGDGHVGRLNLSHAFYYAFGDDELNVVAGEETQIRAQLGALEASIDKDWVRLRGSFFYASGDSEPLDDRATGFDSIYDNSNFAGGPFSFWSRSAIALTQTKVLLKGPGTLLPNLRSNKFEGQANFVNPGLMLAGVGMDLEVTPKLKTILNANYLRFDKMETLEALLFQPDLGKTIGIDLGLGVLYRPLLSENILIIGGLTGLLPGSGWNQIYRSECNVPDCGAGTKKLWNAFVQLKLTY
jgi:hypothetical protein